MLLFADGLQGVIELLQILLSVVFQFDPALALAGDDPDLAAETGREFLFTFRQIIHLRRLGAGRLGLLAELFAQRLRLPDGQAEGHDLLRQ